MPRVTQYIRDDDMAAWQAIPNKSEWIHKHLNKTKLTPPGKKQALITMMDKVKEDPTYKRPEPIAKNDAVVKKSPTNSTRALCEHGQERGKCLWKGCKYA